jgi:hypothetical protein
MSTKRNAYLGSLRRGRFLWHTMSVISGYMTWDENLKKYIGGIKSMPILSPNNIPFHDPRYDNQEFKKLTNKKSSIYIIFSKLKSRLQVKSFTKIIIEVLASSTYLSVRN